VARLSGPGRGGFALKKKHFLGGRPAEPALQVPGRFAQLDVNFVSQGGRVRQRYYQFMVIDEATSVRALRISDHNNTKAAMDFLNEVLEHFLSAMPEIQPDNDSSFGPQFT
jgi:hypothetical protein